jgi:FYVE/RhoGEF/PH domain-containing protein 5/6
MKGVSMEINKAIKDGEMREKITSIQASFIDSGRLNFAEPHRLFVKDGSLLKVCRKAMKPRHFFLFNDVIVYAKPIPVGIGSPRYIFHQLLPLDNCRVEGILVAQNP